MTSLCGFRVLKSVVHPFVNFYRQMTNPKYNAVTDVYSKMFAWDFVAFLVIVFGYTSFGPVESTGGTYAALTGLLRLLLSFTTLPLSLALSVSFLV